jgi:hypothetical protein
LLRLARWANNGDVDKGEQRTEADMTYLAISLVVAWSCGLLFLAGRSLNFVRLVYNNLAPGKNSSESMDFFRFYFLSFRFLTDANAVDPAGLTEIGRQYQKRPILNGRLLLVWALSGFILLPWVSTFSAS